MVSGRPGKPGEPDPNPQTCDTDCSQSRGWGHQGCSGHFQEGQKGLYQVQRAQQVILRDFPNFSDVDLPLLKSIDGLSVIGLQTFHCILTQQFENLGWQVDRAIIPFDGLWGPCLLRKRPQWWFGRVARPGRRWMPRGKGMDLIEPIRREIYTSIR